jgi:tetratricopeptide (TPR) repeat protein
MAEMDAATYFERGVEFVNKEDFDQAIPDFEKAYYLDKNNADAKSNLIVAYFNRGVARFQKGDIDNAITDLDEATHLNPEDAQVYCACGYIYSKTGNHDKTIENFSKAIERNKDDPSPYSSRAIAYYEKCTEARSKNNEHGFFYYLDLSIDDRSTALGKKYDDASLKEIDKQCLELAMKEREGRKEVYESIRAIGGDGSGGVKAAAEQKEKATKAEVEAAMKAKAKAKKATKTIVGWIIVLALLAVGVLSYIGVIPLDAIMLRTKSTAPAPVEEVTVRTATITANIANFREGASANTAILKTLKKDDVLTVTGDAVGNWTPVEHEGVTGYISSSLIVVE